MLRQPAAEDAPEEQSQCLCGVIHAHRGTFGRHGGQFGNQRRQAGFEQIEGGEIKEQRPYDAPEMSDAERHPQLGQQHQCYRADEHRFQFAVLLTINDGRHDQQERTQQHGQVDHPMVGWRQAAVLEGHRHHDEHRHLRRMQGKNAEVEAQQLSVMQYVFQSCRVGLGVGMKMADQGIGHPDFHHPDGSQRKHAGQRKNPRHADEVIERRPRHHRRGKYEADGRADHRHRLGAVFLTGKIGQHGGDGGGNRTGTLNGAAENRPVDVGRCGGHKAADREEDQAENDHFLAADAVGRHPERDHQQCLGQAVHAKRQPDQGVVVAARQMFGIQREHWQDQEHAQHAQTENRCQA